MQDAGCTTVSKQDFKNHGWQRELQGPMIRPGEHVQTHEVHALTIVMLTGFNEARNHSVQSYP